MLSNTLLSDDIYVDIDLDRAYLNQYFNYTISKKDLYESDDKIIFYGQFYYYKVNQRIHLNDILSSYSIDYSTRIPTSTNVVNEVAFELTNTQNVLQDFYIRVYQDSTLLKTYTISSVLSYYKDLDLPKGELIELDGTGIVNILKQRTDILPHIPALKTYENDTPGFHMNFYFSLLWIGRSGFIVDSKVDNRLIYKLVGKNSNGYTLNYIDYDNDYVIHSENFDGYDLSQLTAGGATEIGICAIENGDIDSETQYEKVAIVDRCPKDYYLIWYDRTGAYQCQGFGKKSTHSQSITTNTRTTVSEESRPYEKLVEDKWTINSDWLTEDEYHAYESILTSPYLYLYDSTLNCGWWVNCSDKNWTHKTMKNQKKLFNMTVNLAVDKKQRILF